MDRTPVLRARSQSPIKSPSKLRSPIRSPVKRGANNKVKVAVRIKPDAHLSIDVSGNELTLQPPPQSTRHEPRIFAFDRCFGPQTRQTDIYDHFGNEFLDHALEGYNACIFAYGQTGSGKSHTMLGDATDPGLIPQLGASLFARIADLEATTAVTVRLSFVEIYNEHIRDLLGGDASASLRLRGDATNGVYVEGLTEHTVRSVDAVLSLLKRGSRSRATAATNMNDQSSRSHAVITLQIKQQDVAGASGMSEEKVSVVRLVDLAGSERASATGAVGDRLREGGNINRSLVALGRVISTLADNPGSLAPYRDSILTRLLEDSLGGNSRTAMIACVSPDPASYDQTLNTLRYADQAKRITTRARINHEALSSDAQAKRLAAMESELNELRQKMTTDDDKDIGYRFAAFAQFYEEEAAKQQTRCKALEAQRRAVERQNEQLSDLVRELTGHGLSALDDTPPVAFADVEAEHDALIEQVGACRTNLGESIKRWSSILA